jgi:hypothetical protein
MMINEVLINIGRANMCDWGVLLLDAGGIPSAAGRLSPADVSSFANR